MKYLCTTSPLQEILLYISISCPAFLKDGLLYQSGVRIAGVSLMWDKCEGVWVFIGSPQPQGQVCIEHEVVGD